jgi:hypothetical protein
MEEVEVRDATDAEGAEYLRRLLLSDASLSADVRKQRERIIPRLVAEITNGRPLALVLAAEAVNSGKSFDGAIELCCSSACRPRATP